MNELMAYANQNPAVVIVLCSLAIGCVLVILQARQTARLRKSLRAISAQTRRDNDQANQALDILSRNLSAAAEQLSHVSDGVEDSQEKMRLLMETRLEQMQKMVDTRLQTTLEARLGESFQVISKQLESVHRGLGEMNSLAMGVSDLKKVFSNVSLRGTWGEIRLAALLEETLAPSQYEANVNIEGANRVEFAIRMPGREDEAVYLPVDSKFPQEDYRRLIDATETGDSETVKKCAAALERAVIEEARRIHDKYIKPPKTTDFAVMFLPVESLYAEVMKRPGLCEKLQRELRVVTCGPSTLAALLNSLQMGFRSVAIEKRTGEVWQLLGAVRTEFARYGEAVDKARSRLQGAISDLDSVDVRTRAINRKLRSVSGEKDDDF